MTHVSTSTNYSKQPESEKKMDQQRFMSMAPPDDKGAGKRLPAGQAW